MSKQLQESKDGWEEIAVSKAGANTVNPIRKIVDRLDMNNLPKDKEYISLSIGDPTKYSNLKSHPSVTEYVEKALKSNKYNGYPPSVGYAETRKALLTKYKVDHIPLTIDDVYLTNGCSDALNLAFSVLLNENDNILLPCPGFSYYTTLCGRYSFKPKYYNCLPDNDWSIDVKHLESLIDNNTKAILVNSPSNPCGNVLTEKNLLQVLSIAEKYKLPIISDEIYSNILFFNNKFVSLASLTKNVPIITVSGLAKQYLVPGWRVGWIILYDPTKNSCCKSIKRGLEALTTIALGPNSLIQAALPSIINDTPLEFYEELNKTLSSQANVLVNELSKIPQLKPIMPSGSLYLMCKIRIDLLNDITDDVDFCSKLLKEQAVGVLPGSIFGIPNYFRCVICPPADKLVEVGQRLSQFCAKYQKK